MIKATTTSLMKLKERIPTMLGMDAPKTLRMPISFTFRSAVKMESPYSPRQEIAIAIVVKMAMIANTL